MKNLYLVLIIIVAVAVVAVLTSVAIKKEWFKSDSEKIKDAVKGAEKFAVVEKVNEINDLQKDANEQILALAGKTSPNNLALTNLPSPQAKEMAYELTDQFLLDGSLV
jgi:uncharacterized membrane protein